MRRNIFFDLDGTLIDPRRRLYALFMELVPQAGFTFDEYWQVKRNRTDQNTLLSQWFDYTPEQIKDFKKSWLEKVEEEDRLALDTPFERTGDFLTHLARDHDLYTVTARQESDLACAQITRLGLRGVFREILVTRQSISKTDLIRQSVAINSRDIFIGDTGEDVMTAKELGIISVGVCSGFLCRQVLEEYSPNYLIENAVDLHETGLL